MIALLLSCSDPISLDSGKATPAEPDPVCVAIERPATDASVVVTRLYEDVPLSIPVAMVEAPGDPEHWYVVEKIGRITRFSKADPTDATVVLDITDRVYAGWSEDGLLGLAFHPAWPTIPEIFVNYTDGSYADMASHIVRFTSADGESFDPDSEERLIDLDQPFANHKGGDIVFGADGYAYIGFGDGGSAGDPYGNGQNTDVLLGKMLRIDVDSGDPYGIPADNPFADGVGGLPELYAWGLRNPWRYSFDPESGELWVGDVGQNAWEEVDVVERGGNYGWDGREGTHCYTGNLCDNPEFIDPVLEYAHTDAGASIVGGYVYRGAAIPALAGLYLYADTVFSDLYVAVPDPTTGLLVHTPLIEDMGFQPTSFAVDTDQELYLLGYTEGGIYRVDPGSDAGNADFPTRLSETGCARPSDPSVPVETMLPYDVNVALWSDDAEKARSFALPEGALITVGEDGDFDLPQGSVVRKDFALDGALIETRLLMRDSQGWAGYSYRWEGDDATLLTGAATNEAGWAFPSRGECLHCHTAVTGQTIGLEQAQVDRDGQLADWAAILSGTASVAPLAALEGTDSVEARARSYLHANCAYCHRPEGVAGVTMDLRVTTVLADMGVCDVAPDKGDLGATDPKIVAPGEPDRSTLLLRMRDDGLDRMPPLGTHEVDVSGAGVVEEWIVGLASCD